MTAIDVYRGVRSFTSNHDHRFENVYVHDWEADYFSVTSTGYVYEIEVKVSRSDFLADFKKPKHRLFKTYKTGYGILPQGESWRCEGWPLQNKYPDLKDYEIRFTNIKPCKFSHQVSPNRFFFACPVGMLDLHEIPEYAGLIYIMDSGDPRIVKKAPLLHKDPIDIKSMLFSKYYSLVLNLKEEI